MNQNFLVWHELFAKVEKTGEVSYTALFYRRDVTQLDEKTREVGDIEFEALCTVKCTPGQKWRFEQLENHEVEDCGDLVQAIFDKYTFDFMVEDCYTTFIDFLKNWCELESNEELGQMIFCYDIDQCELLPQ
jgi:hypothetical protein